MNFGSVGPGCAGDQWIGIVVERFDGLVCCLKSQSGVGLDHRPLLDVLPIKGPKKLALLLNIQLRADFRDRINRIDHS